MSTVNWWQYLLHPELVAKAEGPHVVIAVDGASRTRLRPEEARSFGMHLLLLADRAAGCEGRGPSDGRLLEWRPTGCHIESDPEPLRDGDSLYMRGDSGWLRGVCISGAAIPLLKVTRGVLYVRPRAHPLGEPTLFCRVSDP